MKATRREPDLGRLQRIMDRLREGCPWDRAQTLDSLRRYLLEEAYEVLDVMDGSDTEAHAEELGDLLLQIVFQSRLREDQGAFQLADTVDAIAEKLIRRHPHIFDETARASGDGPSAGEVSARWHAIKRAEGKDGIDDVPQALPALSRAAKVGKRAARAGFTWPDSQGALDKLSEEVAELGEAVASGQRRAIVHELGDVLFAAVNVARYTKVDPELALRATTARFIRRFQHIERRLAERSLRPEDVGLAEMDVLWDEAKRLEAEAPNDRDA